MKKMLAVVLCLVMCFSFSACKNNVKNESSDDRASNDVSAETYTYRVSAVQGVDYCIYCGPDKDAPAPLDPEKGKNKIHAWTECIICGHDGYGYCHSIPVEELDFSSGDTIMYTGADSCWECERNGRAGGFMWAIEITRTLEN